MTLSEVVKLSQLGCMQSTRNGYQYKLNLLVRYLGDVDPERLTAEDFNQLRKRAIMDVKATSIEGSIKDVSRLLRKLGVSLDTGVPLRVPEPDIQPANLTDIDASIKFMPRWCRAFVSLAYVTALRRGDLMRLDLATVKDRLTVQANKTGKTHRFPIPLWCQRQLTDVEFPKTPRTLYRQLKQSCRLAGVEYYTPQQIRQLSAQTWDRLDLGLGALILGHSLPGHTRSTGFYLSRHQPLFDRIHDFPAPPSLLTPEERCTERIRRERLQRTIQRLTAAKLETLIQVAEGLAG